MLRHCRGQWWSVMAWNGGYTKKKVGVRLADDQLANTAAKGFGSSCHDEASWAAPGWVYHWALQQVSGTGSSGDAAGVFAGGSGDGGSGTAGTETHQLTGRQSPVPADSPEEPLWMAACPCKGGIWRSGDRQLDSSEHEQRGACARSLIPPHTKPQNRATWNELHSLQPTVHILNVTACFLWTGEPVLLRPSF